MSTALFLSVCVWFVALHARFAQEANSEEEAPIVLFAVRHAEKERGVVDAGLTPAGHRRAEALAELLGDTDLVEIFSSDYKRCCETVMPLAMAQGREPTVIEAADPHRQIAALRALRPGSVAVLCGHANTVPALLGALGGKVPGLEFGMIAETCYDRLFVATFAAGPDASPATTTVHVLRYGERC